MATFTAAKHPSSDHQSQISNLTSTWLRFRNNFGAFWALRILGRINLAAQLRNWPLQLHWSGFEATEEKEPSEEQLAELEQTIATLLRRFIEEEEKTRGFTD